MITLLLGRALIAALIIAGIFAFGKFILDASKKGTSHVR